MENPTILTNEGWRYLRQGCSQNFNKPEEYYKKSEKYFQKAEDLFQKAIKLDNYNAEAYAGLGRLIMVRNHLPYNDFNKDSCQKALEFFNIAISIDEKNERVRVTKYEALLCLGDFDKALAEIDVIEKNGTFNECKLHGFRAKAYREKFLIKKEPFDKKMAIMEVTDYMECDHSGINLFRDVMRTMKDFDSTEKYLKHAVELKPYQIWPYICYYELLLLRTDEGYIKNSDISEATRLIRDCKANTNFNIGAIWELYLHRANFFFNKKDYGRALVEYTESFIGNSQNSFIRERISFLCSQFSDDRCIKTWQKIIQAHIEQSDCINAAKEFKIQYSEYPRSFEQMKDVVSQCKDKK
ncbi:MAG: hypothetical protein CVU62_10955 [Deltaproteobacteria bacterium HGW-Deltaproteobacteria-2]|nr:MAG: hypothetical protein CVU62_10955 [Deltaproteobacteria bacterium HGW-Deltaproteobacteria-2]